MSSTASGLYEFGPFRLDLERRLLSRAGQSLPLPPKTFELLLLLIQSPGRAFSKRELMSALWADTYVEEANLSFQISVLRKALGGDAAWIETIPKHGYRFSADVRASVASDKSSAEPRQRKQPTLRRDAEAQQGEGVAGGARRSPWPYSRSLFSRRSYASRVRRRSQLRPPSPFRSRRIRDTSWRPASRTTAAGSPFPGTVRRRITTTSTSKWPGRGTFASDDEPCARRLACVFTRWPFHRIHPLHIAEHSCGLDGDPSAWRRRKGRLRRFFRCRFPGPSGRSPISLGRRTEDGLPSVARHPPTAREASG